MNLCKLYYYIYNIYVSHIYNCTYSILCNVGISKHYFVVFVTLHCKCALISRSVFDGQSDRKCLDTPHV